MSSGLVSWLVAVVLVCAMALIGVALWWDAKHQCVRHEVQQRTCGGGIYCAMWNSDGTCMMYTNDPEYPCAENVCVERKP
jgi:hypothetical protein